MHEISIAVRLIELAVERAVEEQARSITAIELEVGTRSGIIPEALEFCFEAAARHTLAEGAALKIHAIPGLGRCPTCGGEGPLDIHLSRCPACDDFLEVISPGDDLRIQSILIDTPD